MDKNQVLKKLQMMEVMYVPYARATNMPFIVCDEETYNDQIFIFREEKDVQVFAKEYTAKSIPLMGVKFKNDPRMFLLPTTGMCVSILFFS